MTLGYAVLSTYPPTQCGLATFTHALLTALESPVDLVRVVRVADAEEVRDHPDPTSDHVWVRGTAGGAAGAAAALNAADVAVVQHEYGIFPGPDGEEVLTVVRGLRVPLVTVLHTVLVTPSERQRAILEELAARSSTVVVMTRTGRDRLAAHYAVDPRKVVVVPHGAAPRPPRLHPRQRPVDAPPVLLTWGLIGEGKGIEWGIEAMARLGDLSPRPEYHVVGQTHPKVRARLGEAYRDRLVARAAELGVADQVRFDDRYLTTAELHQLVEDADVVLLPYDSREQVTSGVLIEAVVAGKPVISTPFPHAVELLGSGAGLLVERQDPAAIAAAVRRVFTEPGREAAMAAEAERIAPDLLWPAVADRYRRLAARLVPPSPVRATA